MRTYGVIRCKAVRTMTGPGHARLSMVLSVWLLGLQYQIPWELVRDANSPVAPQTSDALGMGPSKRCLKKPSR